MSDLAARDRDVVEAGYTNFEAIVQRIVAAFLALMLLPLFALVAMAVVVSFGRPLFFAQTRAGYKGTTFTILKFRSLLERSDASGNRLPDEMRMTPMSRLLRRSRLDELPQLICVARGEMSFIGPRPLLPETIVEMGNLGAKRCTVRPGLTGWAQTCGNTFLDDMTKVALDIWYIDHRSSVLDLRVLWATFNTMVFGERKAQQHIDRALAHIEIHYGADNLTGQRS